MDNMIPSYSGAADLPPLLQTRCWRVATQSPLHQPMPLLVPPAATSLYRALYQVRTDDRVDLCSAMHSVSTVQPSQRTFVFEGVEAISVVTCDQLLVETTLGVTHLAIGCS